MSSPEKKSLGSITVPISFGEQVITSLLFNHDANPVHHRPDHAVQWMLGLLSTNAVAAVEPDLEQAGAEELTYSLGYRILQEPGIVVMPGIIMSGVCIEHFVKPEEEHTISITSSFTYPLLVPTKGQVDVEMEAYEVYKKSRLAPELGDERHLLIEAFGPSVTGARVRLLKLEAVTYAASVSPEALFDKVVKPAFAEISSKVEQTEGRPELHHPAAISEEDRRRYVRIVDADRRITPSAWQAKIPRVLTETIDHMRGHDAYQQEVKAYYDGRADEAERREAIAQYVNKERKYRLIEEPQVGARISELAGLTQQLYARQHTIFDPRLFVKDGPAVQAGTPFILDLLLYEMRLRRGIHRFYTGARLKEHEDQQVFMGDAMVTGQPLVTQRLANFLCEINHSFATLKHFEYKKR